MPSKEKSIFEKLNPLAIDLFNEYKKSQTFMASVFCMNQRYFLREIVDMKKMINSGINIDCVNLYNTAQDVEDIYPSRYISHKIEEGNIYIELENKNIEFKLTSK